MRKTLKGANGGANYHHHVGGATYSHHGQSQPQQQQTSLQSQHHYHQHDQQQQHHHHHQPHHHHQRQHSHQHNSAPPPPHLSSHNNNNNNNNNQATKYNNHSRSDNESNINHVLLITVINPHYTVTCDLIHQICNPYGKVNRIVIFRKNGVQAMVEFEDIDSAKRAKSMLNGCDIFSDCCTLKIEYAKPTRLNIHRNDINSWDYTNPNLVATGQSSGSANPSVQPGPSTNSSASNVMLTGTNDVAPELGDPQASQLNDTVFHQDTTNQGTFNVTRDDQSSGGAASVGIVGGPNMTSSSTGQHHHSSYGGPDSYAATAPHGGTQDYHQQHPGNNYSRQTGDPHHVSPPQHPGQAPMHHTHGHPHQQHHQHHHQQQHHHHHHHHPSHSMPSHHSQHHHYSRSQITNSAGGHLNFSSSINHGPGGNMGVQSTVMMVYGLQPDRINCDRLFNLFCLYGNVAKVKFLRTKEGCAMVQMGDVLAIERCVSSLNKMSLFGSDLQISYSKQPFLHDVMQPFILPDGSPSFKDFTGNKNNRFKNPEVASKNRISPPSQVLHFFNAPLGTAEDELVCLFKQTADHEPLSIKIFTPKTENSKSFSGLATFKSPVEASEALVICNHMSMPKPGVPHPHILRLCFSPPAYARPHQQSQHNQHHQSSASSPQPSQQQQQQQQPQQQASEQQLQHQGPNTT